MVSIIVTLWWRLESTRGAKIGAFYGYKFVRKVKISPLASSALADVIEALQTLKVSSLAPSTLAKRQ